MRRFAIIFLLVGNLFTGNIHGFPSFNDIKTRCFAAIADKLSDIGVRYFESSYNKNPSRVDVAVKHFCNGLVVCNRNPLPFSVAGMYAAKHYGKDTLAWTILKTSLYSGIKAYPNSVSFTGHGIEMAAFASCDAVLRFGLEKIEQTEPVQKFLKKCENVVGEKAVAVGCFVVKEGATAYCSHKVVDYVSCSFRKFVQDQMMSMLTPAEKQMLELMQQMMQNNGQKNKPLNGNTAGTNTVSASGPKKMSQIISELSPEQKEIFKQIAKQMQEMKQNWSNGQRHTPNIETAVPHVAPVNTNPTSIPEIVIIPVATDHTSAGLVRLRWSPEEEPIIIKMRRLLKNMGKGPVTMNDDVD